MRSLTSVRAMLSLVTAFVLATSLSHHALAVPNCKQDCKHTVFWGIVESTDCFKTGKRVGMTDEITFLAQCETGRLVDGGDGTKVCVQVSTNGSVLGFKECTNACEPPEGPGTRQMEKFQGTLADPKVIQHGLAERYCLDPPTGS